MKQRSVAMVRILAVVTVLIAGAVAEGAPAPQVADSVPACLGCHEDKDLSMVLKDKSKMGLRSGPGNSARLRRRRHGRHGYIPSPRISPRSSTIPRCARSFAASGVTPRTAPP